MLRKIKVFFLVLCILLFASNALAHPGRTDANGGHWDRSNNTYHSHNGGSGSGSGSGSTGTGSDLRAISRPRQQQTLTGFPAGTLPGDSIGGSGNGASVPLGKVVMSGEPLAPVISQDMAGSKLDRISVIAGHIGYTLVNVAYSPTVIDTPYTFALMNGKRKVSTLYFNRNMVLVSVETPQPATIAPTSSAQGAVPSQNSITVQTPQPMTIAPTRSAQMAAPSQNQSITVYVTNTGTKYHLDGCQYLSRSKIPIPLENARRSYEPCSRCNPPR